MTRALFDTVRSGPTTVAHATTMVMATFPMTRLFKGNVNNDIIYVQVIAALFAGSVTYSALVGLTVALVMTAGPTYTLGAVSVNEINISAGGSGGFGGGIYDAITLDQSGGNLRLVITQAVRNPGSVTCIAAAGRMGP